MRERAATTRLEASGPYQTFYIAYAILGYTTYRSDHKTLLAPQFKFPQYLTFDGLIILVWTNILITLG